MPRNGAGVFSLVNNTWFPPVNGVLATATDWTPFITDIQNALTQSVSSDGQTPFTGNLPMGNNKITGLANGTAATDAAAYGQVNHASGQCRLVKSGANLLLIPYNGNQIAINGAFQTIPAAGVSLAPGAAVAGTTYFIYAFMVAAVMTLEFSTTVHATDITTGVEVKSGDSTRTLVGMARPIAGPLWVDTATQRLVISYFNRQPIPMLAFFTAVRNVTAAGYTDLNAEIHNEFLTWSSSAVTIDVNGEVSHTNAGSLVRTTVGMDGGANDGFTGVTCTSAGTGFPVTAFLTTNLSEGFHTSTLLANNTTGAGTASYLGSGTPAARCSVQTIIQG